LHLARRTLRKYLQSPVQTRAHRQRTGKIDPFRSVVAGLLEQDPSARSVVILQRAVTTAWVRSWDYDTAGLGSQLRSPLRPPRAFVRMEPARTERPEVDCRHFGTLDYAGD